MKLKEEAIRRFKNACIHPNNVSNRMVAIGKQFNRKMWELPTYTNNIMSGLIRIEDDLKTKIIVYNVHGHPELNNYNQDKHYERILTKDEYIELEKSFFGNFTPDYYYLEKIGALIDEWRNNRNVKSI